MNQLVTAHEPPDAATANGMFGILHAFDPVTGTLLCRSDLPTYSIWDALLDGAAPTPVAGIRYGVLVDLPWRPVATERFCPKCRTLAPRPVVSRK